MKNKLNFTGFVSTLIFFSSCTPTPGQGPSGGGMASSILILLIIIGLIVLVAVKYRKSRNK